MQNYCVAHDLGVVPYFGLAAAFITGKYRSALDLGKSVSGGRMASFLDGCMAVLAAIDSVAEVTGATLAQIALALLPRNRASRRRS